MHRSNILNLDRISFFRIFRDHQDCELKKMNQNKKMLFLEILKLYIFFFCLFFCSPFNSNPDLRKTSKVFSLVSGSLITFEKNNCFCHSPFVKRDV